MVKKKKKKNQKSNCRYCLRDLEKQRKISLFFLRFQKRVAESIPTLKNSAY